MRPMITCAALLLLAGPALASGDQVHWGYTGDEGPAHWADLSSEYATCGGDQQSPIDLVATHETDDENLTLRWTPFAPEVVNNGHTIQANAPAGNETDFGGTTYTLLQVHFHHVSEHTIAGRHSPMEAHFVHKGPDGGLFVLGVMLVEGDENEDIAKIWAAAPATEGEAQAKAAVDFADLIPDRDDYYRYAGSLTTPPCSEIVDWVVFSEPIEVSADQIAAFAALYPANNRPLQPRNRRFILRGD